MTAGPRRQLAAAGPGPAHTAGVPASPQEDQVPEPSAWGTQRRLRALMNRAWSPQAIEARTGIAAGRIAAMVSDRAHARPGLSQRVAAACDQLWNQPPPLATTADQQLANAARKQAQRQRLATADGLG